MDEGDGMTENICSAQKVNCPICDGYGKICNLPLNKDCCIRESDSLECPDDCEYMVDCYFCHGAGEVIIPENGEQVRE